MRVGATVLLHGLVARPELNGVRGTVVKAADPKSGRIGVRLSEGGTIALKPSNLTDVAEQVTAAVLSDFDLLRAIFSHGQRWERAGIWSGVCSQWRSCTFADPDLYRSIVVVGSQTLPPPPRDASAAMPPPPRGGPLNASRVRPSAARRTSSAIGMEAPKGCGAWTAFQNYYYYYY